MFELLVSFQYKNFNSFNSLTEVDKFDPNKEKEIIDNINQNIHALDIPKNYQEKEGLSLERVDEIKREAIYNSVQNQNNNMQLMASEAAGAFDTYYNHNTTTGNFTVQALVANRKYVQYTGSTIGNPKNASTLFSYKKIVDNYENTVIKQMESAHWSEVAGWVATLTSGALLLASFATGPVGWVAIFNAKTIAEMFAFFIGFTSTAYAIVQRTQLSKNAAELKSAAYNKIWGNSNWDTGTTAWSIVDGY
ncbi:hypothetical protein JFN88_24090 [Paenibacillus sp. MAHUQ-46]|uniref:Uncharacterized protein n=1 Tax=Paenibacillus roseus TaxID=2798579 RepID=A0A934MXL4_9BACL|nr:hypothetical protein [Paenibacillus roseus]MBJ6364302.1 hypothetical protein [Paenibacillus roseus]